VREGKSSQFDGVPNIERVFTTPDLFSESADWWMKKCTNVDTIIHMAWYAEPGKYLQSDKNIDCLIGTLEMAKGAANAGVTRLVGIGTCFEYEINENTLSVNTPLRPLTTYASAKAAAYLTLSQWLPQKKIEFAWCRLFYLYGEGEDRRRLVSYLRSQIINGEVAELTSGKQIRDFLDVLEASSMIVDIAESDKVGAFNICSGVPISVKELAENIAKEYGRIDLLNFNSRLENAMDPPYVVGHKFQLLK
jgi:dTDP-6-deoxy-L-talose 4-dehydrogenase (NAD+)